MKQKKQNKINLSDNKKIIIGSILFIIFLGIAYYITLPIFNFGNPGFYFYLGLIISFIVSVVLMLLSDKIIEKNKNKTYTHYEHDKYTGKYNKIKASASIHFSKKTLFLKTVVFTFASIIVLIILFSIVGSKLFNAKAYYKQLEIVEAPESELKEVFDYDKGNVLLPIIDKDLAFKLAQASLSDYGAQYTIDYDNFTLISVTRDGKDQLLRIAPLEYSNFFVSLNRMKEGTIGYIEVNVVTKETKLVEVNGGLKYMPTSIFNYDLDRHIRFKYPTEMYDEYNFEIDNEGNPYWIIPTFRKQIGVINGPTSKGVIVVNPVNGEIKKYNIGEEPSWVDRTVNEVIVNSQATNSFRYKNGFFNVHFGQKKEVFQLSDGYNYFIKEGQTYYVSCITSPNENDQTSIGFVTVNLKTKQATKYFVNGITEMRAREIAMNDARVKAQALTATWPILINYKDVETYFIVLKNDVQSQKIVFINVKNGELVAMGDTIEEAKAEYDKLLADSGNAAVESIKIEGTVERIRDLGGQIEFTIKDYNDKYFVVAPSVSIDARFIQVGDNVSITCNDYGTYYYVLELVKR